MTEAICKWIPMIENEWPGGWMEVEPLIRCKDCKYYRDGDCWHERENDRWIYYQSVINEPTPDDYCSLGERAEE